ncbi:MAG: class I SAM-dependent methyltransferase [Pirellulales bacterium]
MTYLYGQSMNFKPIAYETYQLLAGHYSAGIDTKPHNAYYERPAMTDMWPDLSGRRVLDAGCGPGVYSELMSARGATVTSVDMSERMLEEARRRLGPDADLRMVDLSQPLSMFDGGEFDLIHASLCLDYIEDWKAVFRELHRILKPEGIVQFSCGHPAFDAEYYKTEKYFSVEQVECMWTGFGIKVTMPSYRRSLSEMLTPPIQAGFRITQVIEPLPTAEFQRTDPIRYQQLMRRPAFLCVQVQKSSSMTG